MRPIKFRAWDKEDEVMCEVDAIGFSEGAVTISNENVKYYHLGINEIELMQYTGLKDKNGVEIYEGDIVKLNVPTYKTSTKVIYTLYDAFVLESNVESSNYIEVSGNIYEHPELLKEQNK